MGCFQCCIAFLFFIVSQRTAPGLITEQLMKEFDVNAVFIGFLTSIQFFAYAGLQIPIGIFSDRYGPNYFLIFGTLLTGVGTLLYSIAPNEWLLICARLLVGVGDAAIWVNLVLILSQWFKVNEFVQLLAFAGMSGSLGFLMASVPFSASIDLLGWRIPFLITGCLLCICGILLYIVLVKKPRQMESYLQKEIKSGDCPSSNKEKTVVILRRLFSNRQAWATFLCHFGVVETYVGFIGSWAVPYGMTRSGVSQLIMVGLIGAIIGAPLTGWITGRIHSIKRPYVIVHIFTVCSWLIFFLFNGEPPFVLLVILFFIIGYCSGASALTFAVVRQSFPIKEVGVVSGFANTGGFLSAVLLPIIFGNVLDHYHGSIEMGIIMDLSFQLFFLYLNFLV
ncbi:MFS transporter [Heyndrickxia sporothermodurans]|nr:MFS transporter [Heyndrickxia sporothermodurans]